MLFFWINFNFAYGKITTSKLIKSSDTAFVRKLFLLYFLKQKWNAIFAKNNNF